VRPTEPAMMQMPAPELELIADYACEIGENPLWHPQQQRIYWTDIPAGRLFCYGPVPGGHEPIYKGRPVGGFTFQADGGLLLFRDCGNVALTQGNDCIDIITEIPEERESRFNDVIADPAGRVFCGTMSSRHSKGRLYRLDVDGRITPILESVGCSNGMGFSPDLRTFYHTDSFAGEIYAFNYSIETGELTKRRIFASIPSSEGLPDGLTVDGEGNIWSALWDGYGLVRFSPDGAVAARVSFPTRKVSSLTFGAVDLQDIYVTTAGGNTKSEDGPSAGALFRFRTDVAGRAEFFSKIESCNTASCNPLS
jgi:D-xylono/L-arabinono-1,4-lactonase